MSRYQILPTVKEEMQGDSVILNVKAVGTTSRQKDNLKIVEKLGENKFRWLTGLNERDIRYSPVLNNEQKKIYLEMQKEDLKNLADRGFTNETLSDTNGYFWNDKNKGEIVLDSGIENFMFDTIIPEHAFIFYGILSGSYDSIMPTQELAREKSAPYYLTTLEERIEKEATPHRQKLEAQAELYDFIKKSNEESLRWFAWVLDKTTEGFTSTTSKAVVEKALVEFLEGKLTKGRAKTDTARRVMDVIGRWKAKREDVISEAVFNVAKNYGLIVYEQGFYYTSAHKTKLHPTVSGSLDILKDPDYREEFQQLIEDVKKELNK